MDISYVVLISLTAALGGLLFGFDTAIISGTIPFIRSYFSLDPATLGWTVSSGLIGCTAGCLLAGYSADRYGRRTTLILCAVFFAVSGVGAALSGKLHIFILFRMTGGLAVGAAAMASPIA